MVLMSDLPKISDFRCEMCGARATSLHRECIEEPAELGDMYRRFKPGLMYFRCNAHEPVMPIVKVNDEPA